VHPRYWLPPALWTGVILLASTDFFSATNSGEWLQTLIPTILGRALSPAQFEVIHFFIRKTAHLIEYAILGALLFRAVRDERRGWSVRWSAVAVLVAAVVASTDEWHQTLIPSRTGAASDVLIDVAGATVAQILIRVAQVLFFKA
jgi:VanZ family protein